MSVKEVRVRGFFEYNLKCLLPDKQGVLFYVFYFKLQQIGQIAEFVIENDDIVGL